MACLELVPLSVQLSRVVKMVMELVQMLVQHPQLVEEHLPLVLVHLGVVQALLQCLAGHPPQAWHLQAKETEDPHQMPHWCSQPPSLWSCDTGSLLELHLRLRLLGTKDIPRLWWTSFLDNTHTQGVFQAKHLGWPVSRIPKPQNRMILDIVLLWILSSFQVVNCQTCCWNSCMCDTHVLPRNPSKETPKQHVHEGDVQVPTNLWVSHMLSQHLWPVACSLQHFSNEKIYKMKLANPW